MLTGLWMGTASFVTHALGKAPDLSSIPRDAISGDVRVQYDSALFWAVNAVGFYCVLLIGLAFFVRAQRRRPWDAMIVALSPALALTAMINWDVLALGCVGGIHLGLVDPSSRHRGHLDRARGCDEVLPVVLPRPVARSCACASGSCRPGSRPSSPALIAWTGGQPADLPVVSRCLSALLEAQRRARSGLRLDLAGRSATTGTRHAHTDQPHDLARVRCRVLGDRRARPTSRRDVRACRSCCSWCWSAFLIVNKVYSPQYVIWLLPLAVLARPRWRDMLIWQACEIFYFFAVWMHIANFFVGAGERDWVYALAIFVRIAGQLYLVALVVRDILPALEGSGPRRRAVG